MTVLGQHVRADDVHGRAGCRREPDRGRGGVPAIVAGLKEGLEAATYSNYGLAMRRFADLTMRPNWRSACACSGEAGRGPDGARLWFDTSAIAALQEGEKERADTMAVLATAAHALISAGLHTRLGEGVPGRCPT